MHVLKSTIAVLLTALGLTVAMAAAASAEPVRVKLSTGPTTDAELKAGGHPDLKLTMTFPDWKSQDVRNVDVDLPAGMIGNPKVTPICSVAEAVSPSGCPADTKIGEVVAVALVELSEGLSGRSPLLENDSLEQEIHGTLYNAQPGVYDKKAKQWKPLAGRPAAIAATLISDLNVPSPLPGILPDILKVNPITTIANWNLRSPGDYGLTNELREMPNSTELIILGAPQEAKVHLESLTYTFFGTQPHYMKNADGADQAYTINPTECVPMAFKARAAGYDGGEDQAFNFGNDGTFGFTPKDCAGAPFDATQTISPDKNDPNAVFQAKQPTGVTVELKMPGPTTEISQHMVSRAEVLMPEGIALSAGVGEGPDGLAACTADQFGYDKFKKPTCPTASEIGTVTFDSPLVGVLEGTVYLAEGTPDAKLREYVYVESKQMGVQVKLKARTIPDPKTGQLTTIFDDLPRQPFTSFKLTFRGGATAVLKAPDACTADGQEFTAPAYLDSFGGKRITLQSGIKVTGCKAATFAPTLETDASPNTAGADTTLTTTIARGDDDDRLDKMNVSLPAGLLGRIASVPACPIADARAGNCKDEAQIGIVDTEAGTGPAPAKLRGDVYLTDAFDGGVAGLAVIVKAKVGPVDLGKVVVIGKMSARKDVGIDLTIDSTPTIQEGVPLYLRKMVLKLYKPGFMFNASNCNKQQTVAKFVSTEGRTAEASADYAPSDCPSLPFDPQMTAKVTGNANFPGFTTTILGKKGDSTLKDTVLKLPKALGVSQAGLGNACLEADFLQGACKEKAVIGSVRAVSDLIPLPLTGPVTLVKDPAAVLPYLGLQLRGLINLDLRIDNDFEGGRIMSIIKNVPDTPIQQFDLVLSPNGLLGSTEADLCGGALKADGAFTATAGAVVNRTVDVDATEICGPQGAGPAAAKATLKRTKKGRKPALRVTLTGKQLKSASITLPSKLSVVRKNLAGNARGILSGNAAKSLTVSGRKLSVKASGGDKSIVFTLDNGALKNKGIKPGQRVTIKVTYTQTGVSKARTINLRVRAAK